MTNKLKEHSKTIKSLTQNAKKGNLLSMFQLYLNYFSGKNVEEVNKKLAQAYLDSISALLPTLEFKINSLNLHEFRRFRSLDINFDKKMTVIIGGNGAGKTSIVESLVKTLTWFSRNIVKSNVSGSQILESDINVEAEDYAEIVGVFQLDKNNIFDISLATPTLGYSGNVSSTVAKCKKIGDMYRAVAEVKLISFPLFAFYSVERSSVKLPKISLDKTFLNLSNSRFNVLKDSLEASTQLDDFSRKYIELSNFAEGEESQEIKESRNAAQYLEMIIEKLHKGKVISEENELVIELEIERKKLKKLLDKKTSKYSPLIKLVNQAIKTLIPDVTNLRVDTSQGNPRILVDNFGNQVNISQLSQGQKSLVALTGDLALRLATLNPDAEKPLHGGGIVIIDEIELHLHPRWQQEVLLGLQQTFPNIQFIVTTHSPQVLSTVDKSCIRILSFDETGSAYIDSPKLQTKGVCSSDVLEQIMGTFSLPPVCEANWLADYSALIAENLWQSEEGLKLFDKIVKHFGENHPEISKLKGDIRTQEFKLKAKALKGL
jgi:predicted ATP-binding protein involved in virulence